MESEQPITDASQAGRTESAQPVYSVILPFYNEQDVVDRLIGRLGKVLAGLGRAYEIIAVDDGSTDQTLRRLLEEAGREPGMTVVQLRRNFGQTTALQAGFDLARGSILVAMDADLQHDPYDLPLLVSKLEEGYDIASGWRVRRGDNWLMRRLPSRVANWLLARISGVRLHDFGTTFKAYRRDALEGVRLYGEMHRFVPAICARLGARIAEVPIKNVRRRAGKSHYGISRTFRVLLDLLTVRFILAYLTRPLHYFGRWGLGFLAGGMGILLYGLVRKCMDWSDFHLFREHGPLMAVGFMLVIVAMLFLATGLMGEMLMRIYFESTDARTYAVRRVVRGGPKPPSI
jgi:glycosyltransferase involved in cell wall biosynthesis